MRSGALLPLLLLLGGGSTAPVEEPPPQRDTRFHTLSLHVGQRGDNQAHNGQPCKKTPCIDAPGMWHSQAFQDRIVFNALLPGKKGGFFVDLAANHPFLKSNSRALERDHGWNGLCIDGNDDFLMQLVKKRRCAVIGAIVSSDDDGDVKYRHWHGANQNHEGGTTGTWQHALSGIVGFDNAANASDGMAKQHGQAGMKSGFVDKPGVSVRFESILKVHRAPKVIDYLSLDVEGAEEAVLRDFPFSEYTFLTLTVERPNQVVMDQLQRNSYVYLGDVGGFGEKVFVHSSLPGGVEPAKTRFAEELAKAANTGGGGKKHG